MSVVKRLVVAAVLLLAAACSNGPESGVVFGKTITPEGLYPIPQYTVVNGVSTFAGYMWIFYPEQPKLYLCPPKDEGDECGWRDVSHEEYAAHDQGDWYGEESK